MEFFRPSVIEAVLLCAEHVGFQDSSLSATSALSRLKATGLRSNLAYEDAGALIERIPDLVRMCTDDASASYRSVLQRMIEELQPLWARAAVYGRDHVRALASPNAIQCLEAGDLMDEPSQASVSWWSRIASSYRTRADNAKARAGQEAEFRSLDFETRRLNVGSGSRLLPRLVSIDDGCVGYDIESYISANDPRPLFIEVKSSKSGQHFFLTRNEWDTLRMHPERAVIHFWDGDDDNEPLQISIPELQTHISTDNGSGRWELLKITVSAAAISSLEY